MPESSPSQLINDWVTAAKSATPNNAPSVAKTIAGFYTSDAVLCATEGIIKNQPNPPNILADYEQNFEAGWVLTGISNQSVNPGGTGQHWAWAYGQWTGTVPNPNPNPPSGEPKILQLQGCWSILFANQSTSAEPNWLIQQHTIVTNPLPPDPLIPPQSAR